MNGKLFKLLTNKELDECANNGQSFLTSVTPKDKVSTGGVTSMARAQTQCKKEGSECSVREQGN